MASLIQHAFDIKKREKNLKINKTPAQWKPLTIRNRAHHWSGPWGFLKRRDMWPQSHNWLLLNRIWDGAMQMNARRQYPRVLSGEQVWVGGRGPPRPTCMHSHLRGEKELMKWPRSAISRSPHTGVTNEPPEREQSCRVAMVKVSWQLSFYSPYPQGEREKKGMGGVGFFPIFTFYKLGAWFTLWRQAVVIFSTHTGPI